MNFQITGKHEHRLILKSSVDKNVSGDYSSGCRGCRRIIQGPHYVCPVGCNYYLHALCSSLPSGIFNHPLHPNHPLVLIRFPLDQYPSECRVCGKRCKGFTYHCLECKRFDIDLLCAWVPPRVELDDTTHQHPLTLLLKPAIFSCDECGGHDEHNQKSMSYMCFLCQYWVHIDCARPPHYLEFGYESIFHYPDPLEKEPHCQICHQQVNDVFSLDMALNFCHKITPPASTHFGLGIKFQNLYFHVGCSTLATRLLPSAEAILMENTSSTKDLVASRHMLKIGVEVDEDNDTKQRESVIKHWSHHDHVLKLGTTTDDIPKFNRSITKCNGCKWPLLAPFYSCEQCNFFLHAKCANTKTTLRTTHSHNHPLSLCLNPADTNRCSKCNDSFTGFSYKCGHCDNYVLDLSCAQIGASITHDAHDHQLFLSADNQTINCNACGNSLDKQTTFKCTLCEFYLHSKCAFLPKKSRHRFDRHPLTLMFKSDKNELGEYICEICEDDKRNPNHWFYGCKECDFAAHVQCIFNQ
ncbi:hypothetical protein ACH5RR_007451 [Cinchona calisaya]|uniref:Phorbol-ester/DAG-type domain-containing protein n=1 Tax=Cinchona calisaya TaxID=153742 RepID=A0ABD3ARY9_9GENT